MTRECPRQCVLRALVTSNVDQRSNDDSHHIVEEFVALDFDLRDAFIAMRLPHLDAKDLSHRLGSSIRSATEGREVMLPDQGLSNGVQVGVVEPLDHSPGAAFQKWVANAAVENRVAIHLARDLAARVARTMAISSGKCWEIASTQPRRSMSLSVSNATNCSRACTPASVRLRPRV